MPNSDSSSADSRYIAKSLTGTVGTASTQATRSPVASATSAAPHSHVARTRHRRPGGS